MNQRYAEQIEFSRIYFAMKNAIPSGKTKLSSSGKNIIFSAPVGERNDLSGRIETARSQMIEAGIPYTHITAAQSFGLSEEDWLKLTNEKGFVGYMIEKKGRKWLHGKSIPAGYNAQIAITEGTKSFKAGMAYVFTAEINTERNKYGSKTTVTPVDQAQAAATQKIRNEEKKFKSITRWLGLVEEKASEGYVYKRGIEECKIRN